MLKSTYAQNWKFKLNEIAKQSAPEWILFIQRGGSNIRDMFSYLSLLFEIFVLF